MNYWGQKPKSLDPIRFQIIYIYIYILYVIVIRTSGLEYKESKKPYKNRTLLNF